MTRTDDYQVRTMRREELAFAIELAAREGWNPGLHDAECFHAADPDGFLVGELAGDPIACISAVSYAGRYGFIGLYIVRPEFRGQGYGWRLWQAGMARLGGHNVGLDGVVAQQGNYAKSGFRLAYRNVRYRGRAQAGTVHASIAPASAVAFEAIRDFDRHVFPEPRDEFLRAWLAQPGAGAYVAREGGRLAGFTVVRPCREGWKIGPLSADDAQVALRLHAAACAHAGAGATVFVDVPEANPDAKPFLAALNLTPVFETARMYTGPDPAIELPKLFGVTTFELG
ncbi:GNAT family N-acetyltransferase [Ramlibacter solisilvae]|uniref:GCN5 family acetyltransferase n=1 Tax=Ramlibacter tataouinensis TaxID=94132 RepID=A0A127JVV8_9BURK|nr:GNAT family N-acetyltransferase [Ramlibacter tataouinensis]AMO24146.1 GCN5 family acetyltransferase [Ramlibacter tataouinensis]